MSRDESVAASTFLVGVLEIVARGKSAGRRYTNAPGHDTEVGASMPDQLTRGPRYESRRFFHERTGDPLSAYVVGGYVIEKARRDWDARAFRGSAGNPTKREWWEVRVQAARGQPGCSLGRNPLFAGVSGQDTSSAASLYPLGPARYFVRLRCGHKKLTDYKPLVTSYCPDCKRRRVVEDVDDAN